MRCAVSLLLAVLLLAPFRPSVGADTLLPSIKRIVDSGTLVIAVVEGARPPMIKRGEDGELSGFDVDLGTDIAQSLGVEPKFVAAGPLGRDIVETVAAGRAYIGLSYLSESVEAAKHVYFTQPYMIEAHTVFINRVKGADFADDCPRLSDLRKLAASEGMLGVSAYGPYRALLQRSGSAFAAQEFDDMDALAASVEAGDLAVSLQGELAAKFFLLRNPAASIRLAFCTVAGSRHRVAAAVRPDAPDLLRWLDLYITQRGVIIDLDSLLYRADRSTY